MNTQQLYNVNAESMLCTYNVYCRPQMFSTFALPHKLSSFLEEVADKNLVNKASSTLDMVDKAASQAALLVESTSVATAQTLGRTNLLLNKLEEANLVEMIAGASKSLGIASDNVNELSLKAHSLWNSITDTTVNPDILSQTKWIMPALGVRIGIQVYMFFKAETWFDRILSILQMFLDFFIDYKVLMSLREFIFGSFNTVLIPSQVVEGEKQTRPQAGFDSIQAFVSSLVAIGGTICVGTVPSKSDMSQALSHFSKKMDVMTRIWRGVDSMQRMFSFVINFLKDIITYFMDKFCPDGVAAMFFEKECEGIHAWARKVYEAGREDQMSRYSWDESHRNALFKLKDEGDDFYRKLMNLKRPNAVATTMFHKNFNSLVTLCNKVHKIKLNIPFRIDPFCVWLDGPPGCSKSYCMNDIIQTCAADSGVPRYNRFYARNLAEPFYSNYSGQFGIGLDDMGASKNTVRSDPWGEFMIMKSNNPYQVQMAECSEKGMQFTSKLVVASSNMAYPHPTEITNVPALWRRRNILVTFETSLTPDEVAAKAGKMDHLRIKMLDPMQPGCCLRVFEKYSDFIMFVRVAFQFYMARQEALVELNAGIADTHVPLDPVLLSPASFKAFMASRDLQEK